MLRGRSERQSDRTDSLQKRNLQRLPGPVGRLLRSDSATSRTQSCAQHSRDDASLGDGAGQRQAGQVPRSIACAATRCPMPWCASIRAASISARCTPARKAAVTRFNSSRSAIAVGNRTLSLSIGIPRAGSGTAVPRLERGLYALVQFDADDASSSPLMEAWVLITNPDEYTKSDVSVQSGIRSDRQVGDERHP